jgi:GT2 family glycosyltransferase
MNRIRVELVTPVHNRREITLQCLRSLSRVDRAGLNLHINVVDDGSTDATADAVREQFPDVNVIRGDGDLWYTAGNNLGIQAALENSPDYILCFNDDSIFDENAVKALVECAERNPNSVIGGLLLLWNEPHHVFQVAPFWNTWKGGWQHRLQQTVWTVPSDEFPVEMIVGNCVLYPSRVFDEFGFPDPNISAQYGDAEFTTRLRNAGWKLLIEPRARVFVKPNDPSVSVLSLPLKRMFQVVFRDQRHGNNLIHQFRQLWHTAPSHFAGAAAFLLFYPLLFLRKLSGHKVHSEKPLSEIYDSHNVLR